MNTSDIKFIKARSVMAGIRKKYPTYIKPTILPITFPIRVQDSSIRDCPDELRPSVVSIEADTSPGIIAISKESHPSLPAISKTIGTNSRWPVTVIELTIIRRS
jgi:hypothetical protein